MACSQQSGRTPNGELLFDRSKWMAILTDEHCRTRPGLTATSLIYTKGPLQDGDSGSHGGKLSPRC